MTEKKQARHGGWSYLATGRFPSHRRTIEEYLSRVREALIRDVAGSEDNMTAGQEILISRVIGKLGCLRAIEEHVRESGEIITPEGELPSCLGKNYLAFANSIRLDLVALGLERKEAGPAAADLGKYLDVGKV